MGKIPKYSRQKFQSTYIGGPQVDKSGSILAEGTARALAPVLEQQIQKQEAEIKAQVESRAESAFLDYSIAAQKKISLFQDKYADNEQGFPEAITAELTKTKDEYLTKIKDERVAARFNSAGTSFIAQTNKAAFTWTKAKQKENAIIASEAVAKKYSLLIGDAKDYLTFFNNYKEGSKKLETISGLTEDKKIEVKRDMIDSHLMNYVRDNPEGAKRDLEGEDGEPGKYNGFEGFTDDMRNKFLEQIESQKRFDAKLLKEAQTATFDKVSDTIADETLPYSQALTYINESYDNGKGMTQRQYTRAKRSLSNQMGRKISDINDSAEGASVFIKAVYDGTDNRIDEDKYFAQILDVYDDGRVNSDEMKQLKKMKRELLGPGAYERGLGAFIQNRRGYLDRLFKGYLTTLAVQLSDYLYSVRKGKDPQEAGEEMIQKATREKLVAEDPSLASVEKHLVVEASYTRRATTVLNTRGKKASLANIAFTVNRLKAAEKR